MHTKRFVPAGSTYFDNYFGYIYEKVVDDPEFGTRWVLQHHLVWWRNKRQRVPRGWVLHHKDDCKTHNALRNLKLITRGEHQRLHRVGSKLSAEVKERMRVAAIKRCTPKWRKAVSKRVKQQHKDRRFGY